MHISKIRQILEWVSSANLARFELQSAEFSLRLTRPAAVLGQAPVAIARPDSVPASAAAAKVAAMATVCGRFLSVHPLRGQPEVRPGDTLEPGTLVGLIAVGELLLPVTATAGGTMGAFLVEDQQLVGYGTPLVSLADPA
jgi:acetyl-CoA carboxylase biotin carboxyl carrier protein